MNPRSLQNLLRGGGSQNLRHGHAKHFQVSPEYRAFKNAKARCQNLKKRQFKDYGGRGIEFRFMSFKQFLAEIGLKPSPKHTLDRIDNDGHYESGNVCWATRKEQANNKRDRNRWREEVVNEVVGC